MTTPSFPSKLLAVFIGTLAWFALVVQLILMLKASELSTSATLIRYFSYFTILTNLWVALYTSFIVLIPSSRAGQFFTRPSVGTATAVYIVAVGLIYNIILRKIVHVTGMDRMVNEVLHVIIPFLFLFYWALFLAKHELKWNAFFPWLIYPLAYCLYVLGSGYLSGFYPYPFMDAAKLGYKQVLLNSMGVTIVFLGFSVLFINIGRIKSSKK